MLDTQDSAQISNLPTLKKKKLRNIPGSKSTADDNPHAIRYSYAKRLAIAEDIEKGVPWREVEEIHGVSQSTIYNIVSSPDIKEVVDQKIAGTRRRNMAGILERIADLALSQIDTQKLSELNAYQLMMISAVAIDKARLLMNLSTENISVKAVTEVVAGELEAIRKRRINLNFKAKSLTLPDADSHLKYVDNQQQRVLVNTDIPSDNAPNTNTPDSQSISNDGIKHNVGYQRVKTKRKLDKSAGVGEGEI